MRRFVQFTCALIGLLCGVHTAADEIFIDLGRGPVRVFVPSTYDPAQPMPLIFLLHGYSSSGNAIEAAWQLEPLAEELGFLYLHPDGTEDIFGFQFWNATDACCDLFGSGVDDSGYLRALIDEIRNQLNVNPNSIHFAGHSNGGFMSYRMACDHADVVASIASLAGATFLDPNDCVPTEPVHTLQIHGTNDDVILYNGGCIGNNCYPRRGRNHRDVGDVRRLRHHSRQRLPAGSTLMRAFPAMKPMSPSTSPIACPAARPNSGRSTAARIRPTSRPTSAASSSRTFSPTASRARRPAPRSTMCRSSPARLLGGSLPDLETSDDSYIHTRSGFGQSFVDLHHMEMQVSASTTAPNPVTLHLTIEARISEPSGTAQVRLFDYVAQQFDLVDQYAIGMTDAAEVTPDLPAGDYVSPQGEIELRIKHIVFVPFVAFTFESWIDLVEIAVR